MDGMTYKRGADWPDEIAFASLADLAEFAAEFDAIVREALPEHPARKVLTVIDYPDGKTGSMSATEFHDALHDLAPLSEADDVYIGAHFVDEDDPAAKADGSGFVARVYLMDRPDYRNTGLTVEGRKLTTVEGVKAALKAAIDRHAEAKAEQEAEEKREAQEAEERTRRIAEAEEIRQRAREVLPPGYPERSEEPGESTLRKFFYNPWTITVGGGLAVVGVAALIFG